MLASLLPGLRDLRTPLATGYLWLVAFWLMLHQFIPMSVDQARGPIKTLFELGALIGSTALLAAASFIAYLVGSILLFTVSLRATFYIRPGPEYWFHERDVRDLIGARRLFDTNASHARYRQLLTFASTILREGTQLTVSQHGDRVLNGAVSSETIGYFSRQSPWEAPAYVLAILTDLPSVAMQLQAEDRDFWDSYDRLKAEADFRFGITPPLVVLIVTFAVLGNLWWLILLIIPSSLLILGYRQSLTATSTLVQAIVLKMIKPPILERLNEVQDRVSAEISSLSMDQPADEPT